MSEQLYRVFISYSRDNKSLVEKIVNVLEGNNLMVMWDKHFAGGGGFPEQIKKFIAHSHVFAPIITEESSKRGWVHQEIGYAMALNIPVLPITCGVPPGEMIRELHAIVLPEHLTSAKDWKCDSQEEEAKELLSRKTFDNLVRMCHKDSRPLYESAEYHEDRTMMMAEFGEDVLELGCRATFRQKGGLSTFNIPDKPVTHPVWRERYGSFEASVFRFRLLRKERIVMEKHAREKGCRLIINPCLEYESYGQNEQGKKAMAVRLTTLLEFLRSMNPDKVTIALDKNLAGGENWTGLGNWFTAQALSGTQTFGYQQTIFTRHAPSVEAEIEIFDSELDELLKMQRISHESSRDEAVKKIEDVVSKLRQ